MPNDTATKPTESTSRAEWFDPANREIPAAPTKATQRWTPYAPQGIAPLSYPREKFTCRATGLVIPKNPIENLQWRQKTIAKAEKDKEYRRYIVAQCARSPILTFNLFLFTESYFDVLADGIEVETSWKERPFVTWPCQDREIQRIVAARATGQSMRGIKSRAMGWSYIVCGYAIHCLLFEEACHILLMSRKEAEVDGGETGKPDSLFAKLRYMYNRLPAWLTEGITDKFMSIVNKTTGSAINGESTNLGAGASGRRSWILVDEAALIDNLEGILQSLNDNTKVRIVISTPRRGTHFNRLQKEPGWIDAAMPWYEHPERGREREKDASTHTGWSSPWYRLQETTRSTQDLAENVDMSIEHSGAAVFDAGVLQRHRQEYAAEAKYQGDILFANELNDDFQMLGPTIEPETLFEADRRLKAKDFGSIRFRSNADGQWKLWCDLIYDPTTGMHRPSQDTLYGFACDPGGGRRRANSVIMVVDIVRNVQVGEWASADYAEHDCARILVAAALFFGGVRQALIGWEANGPGGTLTKMIPQLGWDNCYRRENNATGSKQTMMQLGWFNTKYELQQLFTELQDDMGSGACIVRSAECIMELDSFIFDDNGVIVTDLTADMNTGAREAHGDRGIAAGIMNRIRRNGGGGDPEKALQQAAARNPRTVYSVMQRVRAQRLEQETRSNRLDYRSA